MASLAKLPHFVATPKSPEPLPDIHLINPHDGVVGRRLYCRRCERSLSEDQFKFVGERTMRGGRTVFLLHGYCASCRRSAYGKWTAHPKYTPELDRFWARSISHIRGSARGRGLLVAIEKDDLLGLYLSQDGRCAISGMELDCVRGGGVSRGTRNFRLASVDRIKNDGNYTPDNVQIVCLGINLMKGEHSPKAFVELCRRVVSSADAKASRESTALKSVA